MGLNTSNTTSHSTNKKVNDTSTHKRIDSKKSVSTHQHHHGRQHAHAHKPLKKNLTSAMDTKTIKLPPQVSQVYKTEVT